MKNILHKIKVSYFKSLKGEESFWVVLLGWGVFVYTVSIFCGFKMSLMINLVDTLRNYTFFDHLLANQEAHLWIKIVKILFLDLLLIPVGVVGFLGLILIFIYPALLIISLIKCSLKYGFIYIIFSIIVSVIFIVCHIVYSYYILIFGAFMYIVLSKSGAILMLAISISILIKTITSLSTKASK